MFRQIVAILWESWMPYKLLEKCSVLGAFADYDPFSVTNWPHGTGHNPHTPITHNIAWVAYKALVNPRGWQLFAKTCQGRNWNVLIKATTSLSIRWSFYNNYNLGCFIQIHLILYVKLQWNCHLALIPEVAPTNYSHPPSSSVGSHVLIPSALSSTNI
jgi:hypothetical protein